MLRTTLLKYNSAVRINHPVFGRTTQFSRIKINNHTLRKLGICSDKKLNEESPWENGNHPYWGTINFSMYAGIIGGGLLGGYILSSDADNKIEKTYEFVKGFWLVGCISGLVVGGLTAGVGATYFAARHAGRTMTSKSGLFRNIPHKKLAQTEFREETIQPKQLK